MQRIPIANGLWIPKKHTLWKCYFRRLFSGLLSSGAPTLELLLEEIHLARVDAGLQLQMSTDVFGFGPLSRISIHMVW